MLEKLDFKKKQALLALAAVVLFYTAYQLSFKKAFEAITLNKQLQQESKAEPGQLTSYPQIEKKSQFSAGIVKHYKVKKEDRENRLWQSLSGMAIANQVAISFGQSNVLSADTTVIAKGLVNNQFTFKGKYFNLIRLLDTVSKSSGVGKIYMIALHTQKANDQKDNDKLLMVMGLKGIIQ